VYAEVVKTKARSGWSARRTLRCLGVSRASYYRWRMEVKQQPDVESSTRKVQVYEATSAEREAVRAYALKHPGIRHRELAWRMVDEDVACSSPSTVYRILKEENLVSPWRRRDTISREFEKAAKGLGLGVAKHTIRDLQAYRDAAQQGTVVTRTGKKAGQAAVETRQLFTELAGKALMLICFTLNETLRPFA